MSQVSPIEWSSGVLRLLDQRALPDRELCLEYREAEPVAEAIRDMVVRGAPAIGISAAYGAVLALDGVAGPDWRRAWDLALDRLREARPTAVNLAWAIERMRAAVGADDPVAARAEAEAEAIAIHAEDRAACRAIGEAGAALLPEGARVVTHCNAGALATGGIGTALGVVRVAREQGRLAEVLVGETRPWLQGARLTAWELARDGIPVTLMTDSALAAAMRSQSPDWLIVGADRIAANGDVANKIGTYALAVLARHHGVQVMVAAPSSTVDPAAPDGDAIEIEARDPAELWAAAGAGAPPAGVRLSNPVFDLTPAGLVDAIVTEHGVLRPPYSAGLIRTP